MSTYKKINFYESEAGIQAKHDLQAMAADKKYHTVSTYNSNSELYPDNKISFVEKHMHYLRTHPNTDPQLYISNLRLMTKIK